MGFYLILGCCWLLKVVVVGNSKYHLLSCMKYGNITLEFWLQNQVKRSICYSDFDLLPN